MDQIELTGTENWISEETLVPLSKRSIRLRYRLVRTVEALDEMRQCLVAMRDIAWDTETSGLSSPLGARICGHALAAQTGPQEITAWYTPIRHHLVTNQLPVEQVSEAMRAILNAPGRCGYAHAKFEWLMGRPDGVSATREPHDVQILAQLADENEPTFKLKALAAKYVMPDARNEEKELDQWMRADARSLGLRFADSRETDEIGIDLGAEPSYLERFGYARTPVGLCGRYACRDVFYTLYLWLVHYRNVGRVFPEVYARESQLQRELHEMEWRGIPIDEAKIRAAHDITAERIRFWRARVSELVGREFDPNDNNLRKLFYEEYGYAPVKWTEKKIQSTDHEARKLLEKAHPECAPLMDALSNLADAAKLHSTYSSNFLRYVSSEGRLHPAYNMVERRKPGRGVPVTGRLASQNPNVQNIPRDEEHLAGCACAKCGDGSRPLIVDLRGYFAIPPGFVWLFIDFNQIELRVLAWLCQDPNLLNAYHNGLDVHRMTEEALGIPRPVAKQANFLTVYGGTEMALAQRMPGYYDNPEGTRAAAREIIQRFFQRYPAIKRFENRFAEKMLRNNCMFVSPFGRPRRIPDLRDHREWVRAKARRRMMSSIVSGSAADLMKLAMLRTAPVAREAGGALMLSIHDELVFELPANGFEKPAESILAGMTDWPIFRVGPDGIGRGMPIEAKADIATTSWREKQSFGKATDGVVRIG